jgi:S1/P1 Nuclease
MMKRAWIALILCLASLPVRAWDDNGHKVIARIAWDSIKKETRDKAIKLLKAAPPDSDLAMPALSDRELFLRAATWPDIVRDKNFQQRWEKYHHGKWHYINWFWEPGPPPRDRPDLHPDPENIVQKLNDLQSSLADAARSDAERAIDLAWVLHLVGDIHQPLHSSARVTPKTPKGDEGGNLFKLTEDESLHWYWDQILVRIYIRRPGEDFIAKIAGRLEKSYPEPSQEAKLLPGRFEDWAKDGFAICKNTVYVGVEPGRMPSQAYRENAWKIVKPKVALAGYRLADFLDRALAGGG